MHAHTHTHALMHCRITAQSSHQSKQATFGEADCPKGASQWLMTKSKHRSHSNEKDGFALRQSFKTQASCCWLNLTWFAREEMLKTLRWSSQQRCDFFRHHFVFARKHVSKSQANNNLKANSNRENPGSKRRAQKICARKRKRRRWRRIVQLGN